MASLFRTLGAKNYVRSLIVKDRSQFCEMVVDCLRAIRTWHYSISRMQALLLRWALGPGFSGADTHADVSQNYFAKINIWHLLF